LCGRNQEVKVVKSKDCGRLKKLRKGLKNQEGLKKFCMASVPELPYANTIIDQLWNVNCTVEDIEKFVVVV